MDYIDLGKRVRLRRLQLGWTQERLAREIGVSTSFVGHVERGSRKASLETLVAMANAMDVSVDGLLSGSLQRSKNTQQKQAMRDLLAALQDQLTEWGGEEEDG